MLKINVLAAATAAALFAVGGAVAQTSTSGSTSAAPSFSAIDKNNDGQISRQEWSEYERTARPAGGVRSDKQPTATSGPRDVGGSDKAKNPGSAAGTTGSRSGSAAAGSTGAAAGSTGAASSTDKAPTAASGPKEAGGTDKSMSSGSSAGSTSSGAATGSTSADKKDAERGPTAPTGEPKVGGSKSN